MRHVERVGKAGFPQNVMQRGNRQADAFLSDADRPAFLACAQKYVARHGLTVRVC